KLQSGRDAEAAAAGLLERTGPEGLLQSLAHNLEIDAQRRQRVRVDARRARAGAKPAGERLLDRVRADPKFLEDASRALVGVANQRQQHVLGADVVVAEPACLVSATRKVGLGRADRLCPRCAAAALAQSH